MHCRFKPKLLGDVDHPVFATEMKDLFVRTYYPVLDRSNYENVL